MPRRAVRGVRIGRARLLMSGIHAVVVLDAATRSDRSRDTFTRLADSLLSLDPALQAGERVARDGVELGFATPADSPLVSHLVETGEPGSVLLYLGDGRVGESALREIADSGDYATLTGFFTLIHVRRQRRDGSTRAPLCTLVRDRSGSFTMVYRVIDDMLCVAPRVAALHLAPPSLDELDPLGLGFLLSSGYIPGAATQFGSIRSVEAGTALGVAANGTLSTSRYWRYPPTLKGARAEHATGTLDRAVTAFEASVAANYDDPRRTVVFLSGGVDSRAIAVACAARAERADDVHTVSWGEREDIAGSDAFVAREIARRLGTRHEFLPKRCTDYGGDFGTACRLTDWLSDVPYKQPVEWRLMDTLASSGFRACLRGDQVFTGERAVHGVEDARSIATLYRLGHQGLARQLLHADVHRRWSEASEEFLATLEAPEGYSANDLRDLYRFEHEVVNMHQTAAMYKSRRMDHRNPILDDHFLGILPLTRSDDRSYKRLFTRILTRIADNVSDVPLSERGSDPDELAFFVEGGPARPYLSEALEDASSPVFELFDREALRRFVATLSDSNPRAGGGYRKTLRRAAVGTLFRVHPRFASALSHRSRASSLPWQKAIGRFLVIKHFMDTHFRG